MVIFYIIYSDFCIFNSIVSIYLTYFFLTYFCRFESENRIPQEESAKLNFFNLDNQKVNILP